MIQDLARLVILGVINIDSIKDENIKAQVIALLES